MTRRSDTREGGGRYNGLLSVTLAVCIVVPIDSEAVRAEVPKRTVNLEVHSLFSLLISARLCLDSERGRSTHERRNPCRLAIFGLGRVDLFSSAPRDRGDFRERMVF